MNRSDTNKDADFKLNWKRVAITSMFGLGFVGNVGHFWFLSCFFHNHLAINAHVCISPNPAKLLYLRYRRYGGLDIKALICTEVNTFCGTVAAKVAMDGLIFGPIDLLIFFT
ncbi:hypothetical protein YC2023_100109 [Brassica napus]